MLVAGARSCNRLRPYAGGGRAFLAEGDQSHDDRTACGATVACDDSASDRPDRPIAARSVHEGAAAAVAGQFGLEEGWRDAIVP